MKTTELRNIMHKVDVLELQKKLGEFRRKLFDLTLNTATTHVKDYSQFKKLRSNIARVLTYMRQKKGF